MLDWQPIATFPTDYCRPLLLKGSTSDAYSVVKKDPYVDDLWWIRGEGSDDIEGLKAYFKEWAYIEEVSDV